MPGVIQTYDHPFSPSDHETIDRLDIPVIGEIRAGRVQRAAASAPRP